MGTLNNLMAKAQRLKEETYGDKPSYFSPKDIHPSMKAWIVSFILTVWAVILADGLFLSVLVLCVWLVTQWAFWRAKVLL